MASKRFAIITPDGPLYSSAHRTAEKMAAVLTWKGSTAFVNEVPKRCSLAISIGGDGTMMHTVSKFSPKGVPTIGINAGDVGFLTSGDVANWESLLDRILNEEYVVEKRIALRVRFGKKQHGPFANDVVLKHPSSVAYYKVLINGQLFYERIAADGVIVATPTGSTAYNTSVGGPVILPSSTNVVLNMISPMRVSSVPIVLEELAHGGDITITVEETKGGRAAELRADAVEFGDVAVGQPIKITAYQKPILFATFGLEPYVRALHEKKGFAR